GPGFRSAPRPAHGAARRGVRSWTNAARFAPGRLPARALHRPVGNRPADAGTPPGSDLRRPRACDRVDAAAPAGADAAEAERTLRAWQHYGRGARRSPRTIFIDAEGGFRGAGVSQSLMYHRLQRPLREAAQHLLEVQRRDGPAVQVTLSLVALRL